MIFWARLWNLDVTYLILGMNAPKRPGRRSFILLVLPGSRCSRPQSKMARRKSERGCVWCAHQPPCPLFLPISLKHCQPSFKSAVPRHLTLRESPVTSALAKSGTKLRPLSTNQVETSGINKIWGSVEDPEGQHASLAHLLLPLKVQARGNVHCLSPLGRLQARTRMHTRTHTHSLLPYYPYILLQILI